jgi:uroporphyrinogen decarboxylase
MNSRERMLGAIARQPVDRIPTDIWATPEVWEVLRRHFGEDVDVRAGLHIDGFAWVGPRYVGPAVPALPDGQSADYWGIRRRRTAYGTGAYDEQVYWPLAGARSIDDLDAYLWPQADWFDYSSMRAEAQQARRDKVVKCGYMAPFYYHNMLRGLEQSMVDPLEDPPFAHELLRRISDFFYEHHRRMFQACEGLIDVAEVTDDLGCQTGALMSLEMYRQFYAPHHRRLMGLCREFGIKVMHHDDGGCRLFLPDLVAMGIEILNPVQWRCRGMDMGELKAEFGNRICFHGAIDNQQTLPFGTPEDVRAEVRRCIDILACDGTGYILSPCHCIQPVTPVENILAMYDEAWRYGQRR